MRVKHLIFVIIGLIVLIIIFSTFNISESILNISDNDGISTLPKKKDVKVLIPATQRKHYEFIIKAEDYLNLNPLINTSDSISIRIWLYPYLGKSQFLYSMSNSNGKWEGKLFMYQYDYNNDAFENLLIKEIFPKSNWYLLFNKISQYGIFVLPDMDQLSIDKSMIYDGFEYFIEVLDDSYYRFYTYFTPDAFIVNSFECERIYSIVKLIDNEFEIDSIFYEYRKSR